jgi:hypothetical protein
MDVVQERPASRDSLLACLQVILKTNAGDELGVGLHG